jgi:membrane-associated phospholipid phosphatase
MFSHDVSRSSSLSIVLGALLLLPVAGAAQTDAPSTPPSAPAVQEPRCGVHNAGECVRTIGQDQAGIWTSPLRMQAHDLLWLAPIAAATTVSFFYDSRAQQALGVDKTRFRVSNDISNIGSFYGAAGISLGLYFLGAGEKKQKLEETGRLATESVLDAGIVDVPIKIAINRERPNVGNADGESWPYGTHNFTWDSSFPSGHATASWALAHVIASQYPGLWTSIGAYGFATVVSVGRITGQDHFPSDVIAGGALGFLVSEYVIHHRASASRERPIWQSIHPILDPKTRSAGLSFQYRPGSRGLDSAQ